MQRGFQVDDMDWQSDIPKEQDSGLIVYAEYMAFISV